MAKAPVEKKDVEEALRGCLDPELGVDIVSLGLIYAIDVAPRRVTVTMTLTTPGCPLVPYFRQDIVDRVKRATGISNVVIDLTFDPPWSPDRMSKDATAQLTMLRS